MKNNLKLDNKRQIIGKYKKGRNVYFKLSNGENIAKTKIPKKILIQCNGLKEWFLRPYRSCFEHTIWFSNKWYAKTQNSFKGRTHTKECKERHSKFMKGRFIGEKNHFYGKSHTEETKNILREKCPRYGEKNGFFGKTHSDEFKKKQSDFMKGIGKRQKEFYSKMGVVSASKRPKKTKIEKITEQKLIELGFKFKYNFILDKKAQYDFLINDSIILEVHGDFWHGNPEIYKEEKLTERQIYKKERDKEKKNLAIKNGYKYFYIWEKQIKANDWSILDVIDKI